MDPAPRIPRPPALLTAEASSQPLHQIIPACIIGYLIENKEQTLFFIFDFKRTNIKHEKHNFLN